MIPKAPGTWGSLLGIPLAWGVQLLPGLGWQLAALCALALIGVAVCARAVRILGGAEDPGCVVYDEVIGMAATFLMFDSMRPVTIAAAFALFRIFDVLKPSPAREVERLAHGWGIMADDLVAAVYANLSLHLIGWLVGNRLPDVACLM